MSPWTLTGGASAAEARLDLWGPYALADPWFLLLVPVGLGLLAWRLGRRGRPTLAAPLALARPPITWRTRLVLAPEVLRALALALAALALARPLAVDVEDVRVGEGLDILFVIDRSGSMDIDDLQAGRTRLDVVREVLLDFAERRATDREHAADAVGLLVFARFPELICPPTLDTRTLAEFAAQVDLPRHREEDGTAIGLALAQAVELLAESPARSRVVILLTDGENNLFDVMPLEAAELARARGVTVHTVLAGRYEMVATPFGLRRTEMELPTDELEAIAARTGGRFFRVRDRAALEETYAEIEALERVPREERRYVRATDLYPRFLALALIALGGAWVLSAAGLGRWGT